MSHIDDLIAALCPDGVDFRRLGSLGRRNKGISITAAQMKVLDGGGPVRVFAGGNTVADVAASAVPTSRTITQPSIIVKSRGHIGFTYYDQPFSHKSELWSYSIDHPAVSQRFVYYYLLTLIPELQSLARSTSVKLPQLSVGDTDELRIPVPPIEVQREIVDILDAFTELEAELEAERGARLRQHAHYASSLLSFGPEVNRVTLAQVATIGTGKHDTKDAVPAGAYIFYARGRDPLRLDSFDFDETAIITAGDGAGVGKVFHFASGRYALHQRAYRIAPLERVDARYLYHYLLFDFDRYLQRTSVQASVTSLRRPMFLEYQVPLPPLDIQRRISATLDQFETLVNDLSMGLPAELAARRKQYEHYRDRLLTFKEAGS